MNKPFDQPLRRTSPSFLTLIVLLVFSFTLSGCGGGGGTETIPRELSLLKGEIDRIQERERANNSDDDVVVDILNTAVNTVRGRTRIDSSTQRPIIATTSKNSASGGMTNRRGEIIPEYDADGMLQFTVRDLSDSGGSLRVSTTDPGASVDRQEGFPAAGWKGVALQGETTSRLIYAELFSDIENDADADYLVMGYWVGERKVRTSSNYGLHITAGGSDPFEESGGKLVALTGTATYEGPAIGLYMNKDDAAAAPEFDYFNAKASLAVDFGDAMALGSVSGTIGEGMTEGGVALPELTLESTPIRATTTEYGGWLRGDASGDGLTGNWGGRFFGNGANATDHPGSVAGIFGAKTADDLQAIIGAFGAYKQ